MSNITQPFSDRIEFIDCVSGLTCGLCDKVGEGVKPGMSPVGLKLQSLNSAVKSFPLVIVDVKFVHELRNL